MTIYDLLRHSVKQNASDLHVSSGNFPRHRIDGKLYVIKTLSHSSEWLQAQLYALLDTAQQEQLTQSKQLDFAFTLTADHRCRVNIFWQYHGLSAVFRFIPQLIPELQTLLPPKALIELSEQQSGLVLITGATGSGKSTTLAALLQYLAATTSRHIITLEDPIEFVHTSETSLIQQREVGVHVESFHEGLYAALRQDPDVLLLGELRDKKSVTLALTAAETGHLVLSTLHTNSAINAIERIINLFSGEERHFIAYQLASCLHLIVGQTLFQRKQGGRVALYEVLKQTHAVSNLIREEKWHQLLTLQQTNSHNGMQTMEQAIALYQQRGII